MEGGEGKREGEREDEGEGRDERREGKSGREILYVVCCTDLETLSHLILSFRE